MPSTILETETDIKALESYPEMVKAVKAQADARAALKRLDEKIEQAHQRYKEKERERKKSFESDSSTYQQTQRLQQECDELKDKIPPLLEQQVDQRQSQKEVTRRYQAATEAFLVEAVPAITGGCNRIDEHLSAAIELMETIASNEVAASKLPLGPVPVIHAGLASARDALRHLRQCREKFDQHIRNNS